MYTESGHDASQSTRSSFYHNGIHVLLSDASCILPFLLLKYETYLYILQTSTHTHSLSLSLSKVNILIWPLKTDTAERLATADHVNSQKTRYLHFEQVFSRFQLSFSLSFGVCVCVRACMWLCACMSVYVYVYV